MRAEQTGMQTSLQTEQDLGVISQGVRDYTDSTQRILISSLAAHVGSAGSNAKAPCSHRSSPNP